MTTPAKEIQLRGDSILQLPFTPPRSLYGAKLGDLNDVDVSADTDGNVLTVQPDGSFALETPSGGGGGASAWGGITGTLSSQTDLQAALDAKAAASHTHATSDVTGLDATLAGKAAASHFHATSDVTGLDAALAGKASSSHTHSTSDVSGFSEAVDDRVASLLVAGTNITITYDDASNTLTVSSTGGGGISGSTGANDNRLLRSDGTGGATVQASGITIDDSNNVSGVGTFAAGAGTFAGIVTVGTGSGVSTIYANSGLASSNTRQLAVRPSDDTSTNAMTLDIYPGSTSTILPSLRMFSSPVTGTTYALQFGTGPATLAAGFWHIGSTVVGDSTADSLPISFLVSNETDGRFSPLVLQINGVCTPVRGVHWESELTGTPTGTTRTINLNLANHQTLQLTSATGTVTVTLTVPFYNSASGTIIIRQHGTTPRGISWAVSSGSIKWLGSQPTWGSDAVNSYRIVSWRWNGSILFLASTDSGT